MADRTKPEHFAKPPCLLYGRGGLQPGHNKKEREFLKNCEYLSAIMLWVMRSLDEGM